MKRKLIASIVFITLVIAGCIGYYIHEQIVSKRQSEIENNSRNDYIRQAREQDSLRIAHHQDSLENAAQLAAAQRETEEKLRLQAQQEAIERKQQEEANRQNEILAQNKNIQEKEYRDNLVERIDTVYTNLSKKIGSTMIGLTIIKQRKIKYQPILKDIVARVQSDTLWMNIETRNKYRFLSQKYQQYLNEDLIKERKRQITIEKKIIELYPKLPPNTSSFKYSIDEDVLRVKIQCDVLIKDVKGDSSWMKGEYKQKYNHIFQCINTWNTSIEKSSDEIKESVKAKEQEIKDKMDQEYWDSIQKSAPKFGLG